MKFRGLRAVRVNLFEGFGFEVKGRGSWIPVLRAFEVAKLL